MSVTPLVMPRASWVQVTLDTVPPLLSYDTGTGLLSSTEALSSVEAYTVDDTGWVEWVGSVEMPTGWLVALPAAIPGARPRVSLTVIALDTAGNRATLIHPLVEPDAPSMWRVVASTEHLLRLEPSTWPAYTLEASCAHR